MSVSRIISGAQTGADRGGLDAAIYCDIPHGGWCPKGRKAEDGRIPDKYHVQELSSASYLVRTERNVMDSDATLVFSLGPLSGGSLKTMEFAKKHGKPVLHIAVDEYSRKDVVNFIRRWFDGDITLPTPPKDCALNVAGSRESKADGIQALVMAIMVDVMRELNPECSKLYPVAG